MEKNRVERASVTVLKEAIELQIRKSEDYQNPLSRVRQADHYPRGVYTILDTVNGKLLRMYSVLETMEAGGTVNFESVEDSAIDAINYLSFIVAYMRGDIDGQASDKDIFNRRGQSNQALIPRKYRLAQELKDAHTPEYKLVNQIKSMPGSISPTRDVYSSVMKNIRLNMTQPDANVEPISTWYSTYGGYTQNDFEEKQ